MRRAERGAQHGKLSNQRRQDVLEAAGGLGIGRVHLVALPDGFDDGFDDAVERAML